VPAGNIHHKWTVCIPLAKAHVARNAPIWQGNFQRYRHSGQLGKLGQGTLYLRMALLDVVFVAAYHVVAKGV
jgi:hypothetical protein